MPVWRAPFEMIQRVAERYTKKLARFNEPEVLGAFERSGGQCECTRSACGHTGRCSRTFTWKDRATSDDDGWQANHRQSEISGGADSTANCEILCIPCHKNTRSYGTRI